MSSVRFYCDIDAIAAEFEVDADMIKRRIALEVYSELLTRTPVDTGRARAGWAISAERPGADVPQKGRKHYSVPSASVPRGASIICIYNNVEYIIRLNEGSSTQAPAEFVESAVQKAIGNLNA